MPDDPDIVDSASPFARWDWDIVRDADMRDPIYQLLNAEEDPLDLTGKDLELYIRPTPGHATLLKKLTSVASAGITIDNAALGLFTVFLARATVQSDLPAGEWYWFLILKDGSTYEEIARGPFRVHHGNTA